MERIMVPTARKIATMSWERCQYMRVRLKNEILLARGDKAISDGSIAEAVAEDNRGIENDQRAFARAGAHRGGSQSRHGSGRLSRYPVIATSFFTPMPGGFRDESEGILSSTSHRIPSTAIPDFLDR
jgi:hypothetical protein